MLYYIIFFFFKQKTAYEMRISDWSSDVCSSDLDVGARHLILARRLDVQDRALDDALESARRRRVAVPLDLQTVELGVEIVDARRLQIVERDAARAHHFGGTIVVQDRKSVV